MYQTRASPTTCNASADLPPHASATTITTSMPLSSKALSCGVREDPSIYRYRHPCPDTRHLPIGVVDGRRRLVRTPDRPPGRIGTRREVGTGPDSTELTVPTAAVYTTLLGQTEPERCLPKAVPSKQDTRFHQDLRPYRSGTAPKLQSELIVQHGSGPCVTGASEEEWTTPTGSKDR